MEKNFFKIPNHLFEHGLSCKAIVVYCALMRHSGTKLMCYPARKTIAAECNISASTVDRALAELASTGLIKKVNRKNVIGGKTSNMYYLGPGTN